jgi:cyclohexanone monooxygenase
MFLITGPGSPSVLSNMVLSIEQHVDWIAECLEYLRGNDLDTIEADEVAENEWVDHVIAVGNMSLFPQAPSWYTGANIPGKPRVFMVYFGGVGTYLQKCNEVTAARYAGFTCA